MDVPSTEPWTPTGLTVEKGQWLVVEAGGEMEITRQNFLGRHDYDHVVGPEGTYVYPNAAADQPGFVIAVFEARHISQKANENGRSNNMATCTNVGIGSR